MAYDLQEQESLDELKAWWEKWGTVTMSAVTVVCLGFAGMNGMKWYERHQAAEAAVAFSSLEASLNRGDDPATVRKITDTMIDETASTVYASMAALNTAKFLVQKGDAAGAEKYLTWLIGQEDRTEYATIARVRLAGLMLDAQRFDEALKTLNAAKPSAKEVAMVKDRLGDVYLAKGDQALARQAWEAALAAPVDQMMAGLVQLKLQALPEAK